MKDPTLNDMLNLLRSKYDWTGNENKDEYKIAIHFFSERWYVGQGSNLYKAICAIDYNPKDTEPDEYIEEMILALETEYKSTF
jgi:hypothetical protein